MVAQFTTYVRKKESMRQFLSTCQFQESTLDLLNYKNLKQLALDYGYEVKE